MVVDHRFQISNLGEDELMDEKEVGEVADGHHFQNQDSSKIRVIEEESLKKSNEEESQTEFKLVVDLEMMTGKEEVGAAESLVKAPTVALCTKGKTKIGRDMQWGPVFELQASIMQVGLRPLPKPPDPEVDAIAVVQALMEMSSESVAAKHDAPSCFVKVAQPPLRKPPNLDSWAAVGEFPSVEDEAEA